MCVYRIYGWDVLDRIVSLPALQHVSESNATAGCSYLLVWLAMSVQCALSPLVSNVYEFAN